MASRIAHRIRLSTECVGDRELIALVQGRVRTRKHDRLRVVALSNTAVSAVASALSLLASG